MVYPSLILSKWPACAQVLSCILLQTRLYNQPLSSKPHGTFTSPVPFPRHPHKKMVQCNGSHGHYGNNDAVPYHSDHFSDSNCFAVDTTTNRVVMANEGVNTDPHNHREKTMQLAHFRLLSMMRCTKRTAPSFLHPFNE